MKILAFALTLAAFVSPAPWVMVSLGHLAWLAAP